MYLHENDEKIKNLIDSLAEEYKRELFKELLYRSNSLEELSASDLIKIDSEAKYSMKAENKNKNNRLYIMLAVSTVYAIVGFFMFFYNEVAVSETMISKRYIYLISIMLMLMSMLVSIVSFFLYKNNRYNKMSKKYNYKIEKQYSEYRVVTKWKELELTFYNVLGVKDLLATRYILEDLLKADVLNEDEISDVKKFLLLRNKVVHGHDDELQVEELYEDIFNVEKIILKLNNFKATSDNT